MPATIFAGMMIFLPAYNLPVSLIQKLSLENDKAEQLGQLTNQQLEIIYEQKWFKLFVSKRYGGLGMNLREGLEMEEELARIDGSLGWTVTLCSGATMFAGYLADSVNEDIFKDDKVCFGGSGRVGGIAQEIKNGYLISGKWPYATGTPHCTIFTANCFIEENGKPVTDENGNQMIRSFFFYKRDVKVTEAWHMMGLKATAGHSFEVQEVQVLKEQSFLISREHVIDNDPIYSYPFLQFAEATLAVNTLGMALHFMELCQGIFERKEVQKSSGLSENNNHLLNGIWDDCAKELLLLRQGFYEAIHTSWEFHINNIENKTALTNVSERSKKLALNGRLLVEKLYPLCGLEAARDGTEINRVWRDIHTASQHSLLQAKPM